MRSLFHSFVRASAFFRKEVVEVLRQPRLILALILGPFLILLLFGLGYQNQPRSVRMLFVADPNTPLASFIQQNAGSISPQLIYKGTISDQTQALAELRRGDVDMVVVAPKDAYATIQNNQQAQFTLYQNEIDPSQVSYDQYIGQLYVDQINRRVLTALVTQGQGEATDYQNEVQLAQQNVSGMRQALQSGDIPTALAYQQKLNGNISTLQLAVGATAALMGGVQKNVVAPSNGQGVDEISSLLKDLQQNLNSTGNLQNSSADRSAEIANLDKMNADITKLNQELSTFKSVSPVVMVNPFTVKMIGIAPVQITALDFFTPAVIVLLLQHIGVTIAALSIVRERQSGAMELFRVSPVSSMETILGKYVSYIVFTMIIGAILAALIYFALSVPMLGSWVNFGVVALALVFASLGYGFVISLLADNQSQAVQLSMIMLLLAVFFSGFLLDLRYFYPAVHVVSYLLPATYGIQLLQLIMLRGDPISPLMLGGLVSMGVILFVLAWMRLRRHMARQ